MSSVERHETQRDLVFFLGVDFEQVTAGKPFMQFACDVVKRKVVSEHELKGLRQDDLSSILR
jgi:hypothetical protein